ncbi:putative reductase [Aerococcus viridans]|uniref:Arsenate reductase n=2 Tax=Aerococcus viridans TaxID=1377 RepID=A0AAU8ULQ1_9LACT|nr:Spx/MgsR family RNA polymerase-binding regulatory protein [Aerococcus viridans]AMC00802.1 arsenate reductase [Aerococcus viridans]EFG50547.1 transcriptional regulator, Spx/MgsR family [Aerococcus viridans ATCC 11563 = CCUG 4311]SUU05848.1 putative reductase [Aerococcus viridans]
MLKIYGLKQCSTTQKVKKHLEEQGLTFGEIIDIRDQPPVAEEIAWALDQVDGKYTKILNTSGGLYRELGLKDKLTDMSEEAFLALLSEQGMLIKRPLIVGDQVATAGSKVDFLDRIWLSK